MTPNAIPRESLSGEAQQVENKAATISATIPDWSRETPHQFWDPFRRLLRTIRKFEHWQNRKGYVAKIMRTRWIVAHRFWTLVTHADIPINARIGGGLMCVHPTGVVLHPDATVGPNCFLGPHIVVGVRNGEGVPTLGGNVNLGAGACVLGEVAIGDNSTIGANAVVISDIPPNSTAVGVPARIL